MSGTNGISDATGFYDELGEQYDEMTQHEKRLESLRPAMKNLADRLQMKRVLDVGCGSGTHAIALAQAGVTVTALDPSPEMIRMAKSNAKQAGVGIDFRQVTVDTLPPDHSSNFDTVICLGNTLPHLLSEESLRATLAAMHELLAPDGHLILQLLNYDRILSRRERIVGIRKSGERTFIRFYDFSDPQLYFNILVIDNSASEPTHKLLTTELYPWRREELSNLLSSLRFHSLQPAGDLRERPFDPDNSTDLIIFARRELP
ncbi:MAG: class I SAM-dependent methyltransferase [bacterium]